MFARLSLTRCCLVHSSIYSSRARHFRSVSNFVQIHQHLSTLSPSSMSKANKKTISAALSQQISSRVQLNIVGNGAGANPVSIALTTDRDTLLINCGEAVQRLVFEHKIRIGKTRHVLFTSARHDNFAGFFGFLLTIAPTFAENPAPSSSSNIPLKVIGPTAMSSINHLYKRFMYHASNIPLQFVSVNETADPKQAGDDDDQKLLDDADFTLRSIPIWDANQSDLSVAYLFVLKDKPGALQVAKCKELGLSPGPLFARLKAGEAIEFNGRTIRPADVLGPGEIGPAFIVLECPTADHIDSLIGNGRFEPHLDIETNRLELMIHITPSDVFADPRYQTWLRQFPIATTQHLVLNRDNQCELSLLSSSQVQMKLNHIDGQVFRLLSERQLDEFPARTDRTGEDGQPRVIRNVPIQCQYNLRPAKTVGLVCPRELYQFKADDIVAAALEELKEDFAPQLERYRQFQQNQTTDDSLDDGESSFKSSILFLGTGSATPGKLRNTSAILVRTAPDARVLLDCGEATHLQLTRYYGRDRTPTILASIRAIFVSHIHADHHFGLVRLVRERARHSREKLLVIAPRMIGDWLRAYSGAVDDVNRYIDFRPCQTFLYGQEGDDERTKHHRELLDRCGLRELATVSVPHCFDSHGLVFTIEEDGKRIAYSGDTMYSGAFDRAGRRVDLLIHEATMNDDLADEAVAKRHSTISQAIQVGRNIDARFTMLTHFSQRYAKIAPLALVNQQQGPEEDQDQDRRELKRYIDERVGFAFDFMHFELDGLERVARMKTVLEGMFADDISDIADLQTKKALKRKLVDEAVMRQ